MGNAKNILYPSVELSASNTVNARIGTNTCIGLTPYWWHFLMKILGDLLMHSSSQFIMQSNVHHSFMFSMNSENYCVHARVISKNIAIAIDFTEFFGSGGSGVFSLTVVAASIAKKLVFNQSRLSNFQIFLSNGHYNWVY